MRQRNVAGFASFGKWDGEHMGIIFVAAVVQPTTTFALFIKKLIAVSLYVLRQAKDGPSLVSCMCGTLTIKSEGVG